MTSMIIGAGALFVGMGGVSILTAIGKDLVCKTISSSTSTTIKALKYITNTDQPKFKETRDKFEKLDLEYTIGVIRELIKEQENKDSMKQSVKKSIMGVDEIINDINLELEVIKKGMDEHQKKYFTNWRTFNCNSNISKICSLKYVLDKRYTMLVDLLKIYNSNNNENKNSNNKFIKQQC